MMIAYPLMSLLILIALIHAYWGLGGRWPGTDDTSFVEHVVGRTKDMQPPPPLACFGVSAALVMATCLVATKAGLISIAAVPPLAIDVAFWGAACVFALRGIAGYIPAAMAYAHDTPFHRLNRLYYSPLCLIIAAGFVQIGLAAN
ncbi:DUF3995 domain-containing protein [Pyruvatibacter sp.]|uniref:DUF3995 domain-containing protein n=1 Tax=Pyruvatibacter sp. TaxID=1981328 RepID=UPI003266B3DC